MDTVSLNTAWGRRGGTWVHRDVTFRSRLGSLMLVRRSRTWASPVPQGRDPQLLERHELAIFGGDMWSALGQFSAGHRGGVRPPTRRSEPTLSFQMSWIEIPLWLPGAACLVLPALGVGSMVRRLGRSWAGHRNGAPPSVVRLAWRGWRAAALGATLVLIVLAAGVAGMTNVAAAIGLPAAAIALIVLTDLPQAWRARGR